MKYEARVHEDLMKSPQGQMGMTAHAKPKGWGDMLGPGGVWILDSVRIAQRNEGRLPIPLPQAERHA